MADYNLYLPALPCDLVELLEYHNRRRRAELRARRGWIMLAIILGAGVFACLFGANVQGAEWPRGVTEIPRPIEVLNTAGNRISGKAAAQITPNGLRGVDATILAWTGDHQGPIVLVTGSETVLEHVSIHGATIEAIRDGEDVMPDVGVLVRRDAKGLATGRVKAYNVNIAHVIKGLKIGESVDDDQCAESDWRSMWFNDCETAITIIPAMAIGHFFEAIRANDCRTVFDIQGGGKLLCDGLFTATANTTLIKLRPHKKGVGHNNAAYEFRHVFLDSQARTSVILDMSDFDYAGGRVVLNGGTISFKGDKLKDGSRAGYGGPAFKLAGNASVTIRDYQRLQRGMFEWHNTKHATRLLIENSCLDCDWQELLNKEASTGSLLVHIRDCYRPDGSSIDGNHSNLIHGAKESN